MNKLLVTIAAAGLGALAFGPAVIAQDSSSEPPATNTDSGSPNQVSSEEFAQADVDNSGELSFDEALTVLPTLTQADFDRLDGNDNGTLSLAEIGDTPKNGSLLSPPTTSDSSSEEPSSSAQ
ncbi:MAG TPA: hypothetical protein VG757_10385 [Devosia sp.]|nr:hypothetical protein [Devosia sp.]